LTRGQENDPDADLALCPVAPGTAILSVEAAGKSQAGSADRRESDEVGILKMLFDSPPKNWQVSTLGEICQEGGGDIQTGPFGSQLHASDYVISGIPSIMPANIKEGRVSEEGIARITEADARRLSKYLTKAGDIVYSRRGDVERCALIRKREEGWLCGTGCLRVRPGSGVVDPDFCSHFLSHPETKEWISRHAVGATMPNLNTQILSALPVLLPSLQEQKTIAHILSTLDDKIELNRQTNETLEVMAKGLFKSWFVDFDPVRAKAAGRPTGLPAELSDLFPDSFEDSELGEIPSGWEVQTVAEVASSIFDGPHATPAESDTGNVFLGIRNMTGTKIELDEIRLIHDDDWEAWTRRVEPRSNDIVFTYEAALGLFALFPPKLKCCLGRRMALIRPLSGNGCPHFWFHQFIAAPFQRVINERCIHGATVNRTPLTEFPGYPVLTPPLHLRSHFEEVASGLWAKIHALSDQSRTLVPLRDSLLPKLISGELRIPDAERLLEEAGV